MDQAAQTTVSEVEIATRFLVELHNVCSLFKLYGSEHPAFRQHAQTAASSLTRPLRISIAPDGFSTGQSPITHDNLMPLARRLRSLGLVSLNVECGLTAADLLGMVLVLQEVDQSGASGDVVANGIAARTGGRVKAESLHLANLQLLSGTAEAGHAGDPKDRWQELFTHCESESDRSTIRELAHSFETALGGTQSRAQWKAMVEVWLRELAAAPTPDGPSDKAPASPVRETRLDAAAVFLQALSPPLCQRLLAETFGDKTMPEGVAMALAERLPTGAVLTALSAASHSTGGASAAALALLGKWASQHPSPLPTAETSSMTAAERSVAAGSLERMLESNHEPAFVPGEYLRRRSELSRGTTPVANRDVSVAWPSERETTGHAAEMVFHILSTPNASPTHLVSGLRFLKRRFDAWVRAGEFSLAAQGISLAHLLRLHEVPTVAKAAQELRSLCLDVEHVMKGARRYASHEKAIDAVAELLRQADGALLGAALCSPRLAAADPENKVVIDAIARVLPRAPDGWTDAVFGPSKGLLPPVVLTVLSAMPEADALQTVQIMLPKAGPAPRCALIEAISGGTLRWPVPLIEWLLKDSTRSIRRLAAMRLVRDTDLATAAGVLSTASRTGQFEPDVGLWVAELLRPHRRDPLVRTAYQQWTWSRRKWATLLFRPPQERRRAG